MKVRTQLVLAVLLLAVLPLAGIVFYSYLSSQRAFRQAVEAESTILAEEMGERLEDVREDIRRRLDRLSSLPDHSLLENATADEAIKIYSDLMARMGDVADLVDWFEFVPEDSAKEIGGALQEPFLIYPSMTLTKALERLKKRAGNFDSSGISQEYLESMVRQAIGSREMMEESELEAVEARGREMERLLGTEFISPVQRGRDVVGQLKAMVPASQLLRQVLARTPRDSDEIPFARDAEGDLYVESPEDRELLAEIGVEGTTGEIGENLLPSRGWMVVETADPASGLRLGIARPIALPLQEIAVVKGLLTTEVSESALPELLGTASRAIKQMNLGRMNMALTLARFDGRRVDLSAAGMPPALVFRKQMAWVEEVELVGTPLGSMAEATYDQWSSDLAPGDTVLLMTDGFPELLNADGEPMGYERVKEFFATTAGEDPERITQFLAAAAAESASTVTPNDDITFMVLRARKDA